MKTIQQYCDVVDRMKQDPACKQAVLEKARRSRISLTKRGTVTGSAVAAALIALNIGIGGYILHRAADDSMTADSQTIEVTETVQTTAASEITAVQTVTAVTDAKPQKLSGEKTVTAAAENRTETEAAARTGTEPEAVLKTAAQTTQTTQPKQDPVQPVETVKPKDDQLSFLLIPADRPYTFAGYDAEAPVVCHVRPSEQIKLQLRVWNDPGMTDFNIGYNIQTFDMVLGNNMVGYGNSVSVGGTSNIGVEKDRSMNFYSFDWEWAEDPLPDDTVLYEITLLAPTEPGHYFLQPSDEIEPLNKVGCLSPVTGQRSPVRYEVSGIEIIVDEEDYASFGAAEWLIDPETVTDRSIVCVCAEPTVAHAGQKNVPVDVLIKGNQPFETGSIIMYYDPALKSLVTDTDASDQMARGEDDRSGIGLDGTLLEDVPWCAASKSEEDRPESRLDVNFNMHWRYSKNGLIYNEREDTVIRDEGVLLRLYFDMPEKCGRYRIYVAVVNLSGYSAECGTQASVETMPTDIIIVP